MEPESTTALLTILQESGPTTAALVIAMFWLNKRVETIKDTVEAKLNNGIRDELNTLRTDIAIIKTQMPKRKTDDAT